MSGNNLKDFGWALSMLKSGYGVRRAGWNGKGLTVWMQKPDAQSKMTLPYLYIEYPDGQRCPWLASQTDVCSEDWGVAFESVKQNESPLTPIDAACCQAVTTSLIQKLDDALSRIQG